MNPKEYLNEDGVLRKDVDLTDILIAEQLKQIERLDTIIESNPELSTGSDTSGLADLLNSRNAVFSCVHLMYLERERLHFFTHEDMRRKEQSMGAV